MITLLYGESLPEPYCIDMRKKAALADVNTEGLNYNTLKGKFDEEVVRLLRTHPMLEAKRGVCIEVESLKDLDTPEFYEYIEHPAKFSELVIICKESDKRTKIYKKLGELNIKVVLCDKKDVTRDKLIKTILFELKRLDARIEKEAMEEFLDRINYDEIKDMTLLTAVGYLKTLAAISKDIDTDLVKKYVPEFKEADAFLLVGLLIKKDMSGLIEQVNLSSPKDAIRILCLILRSYRIAWKQKYFTEVSESKSDLSQYDAETLKKCISVINGNISAIKAGYMPEDIALKVTCSELAACMI